STNMAAAGELRCVVCFRLFIDSAFILKEEQRNAIKAFVDQKDVFAVLPTGFGKSLIYQLAPWSTLWSYYVALIGYRYIQLSEKGIFFPGSVETRPIITAHWSGIRLIFWVCSNRLKMLPSFLPSSLVRKQVLLQMS